MVRLDPAQDPVKPEVLIAGLGNVLMGDDAFGPTVVQHLLARYEFPPQVKVADLGTPGVDLAMHISGLRVLILIDAMDGGSLPPGTCLMLDHAEMPAGPDSVHVDPHALSLREALVMAEEMGGAPKIVRLVVVAAADCGLGGGLTEPVRGAIEPAIEYVASELQRLGLAARRKPVPSEPDTWWTKG